MARAVATPAEVQKKSDPRTKARGGNAETEQLRLENGELRARLDEVTQKNEANRRALEMLIESKIAGHLSELTTHASEARSALTQLEAFVEATLTADVPMGGRPPLAMETPMGTSVVSVAPAPAYAVACGPSSGGPPASAPALRSHDLPFPPDDAKRHAGERFDNTVKDYKASQMPTVLDAISLVLDLASALKSVRDLSKAIDGPDSKALDVAGATADLAQGELAFAKSVAGAVEGQNRAADGDEVSAMTEALSAKVDANDQGDEAVKDLLFGREIRAIRSSLQGAMGQRDEILNQLIELESDGGSNPKAREAFKIASTRVRSLGAETFPRLEALHRLIAARDSQRGGGGELGQGSLGRSVFDLVAKDPTQFSLNTVTKLIVQAKNPDSSTERLEQTGFWLDAKDPTKLGVLALQLAPHAHQAGKRPWLVSKTAQFVPLHIGRPLSTLVDSKVLPHDEVEVRGSAKTLTTTKASWEVNRKYWLGKATANPYSDGGPITFGGH